MTTLLAFAAVYYWAITPITTALVYSHHTTNWTDADLVRAIWHFRVVQPEWVSTPPDYLRWTRVEALVRFVVVLFCWLGCTALLLRGDLRARRETPLNPAL